jgi:hypothetical protein
MAQITVRCTDAELAGFKESAYRARQSLNSWVLVRLVAGPRLLGEMPAGAVPAPVRELTTERDDDEKF